MEWLKTESYLTMKSLIMLMLCGAGLIFHSGTANAEIIQLKLLPEGAAGKMAAFRAQELMLNPARPAGVKKIPKGLTAPLYGTISLGPKEKKSSFTVLLDAPEGKLSQLYFDANSNGDLTDDPKPIWTHKTYKGHETDKLTMSSGTVALLVKYGHETLTLHLNLSRYDVTEPSRSPQFIPLYYSADYAREGEISLSGKKYPVILSEVLTQGDFRGVEGSGGSGVFLQIDVNGNGKIDKRGEIYDISEPFNIRGTTYEIRKMSASGDSFELLKSVKTVLEILPPPELRAGKKALVFDWIATDGRQVKFPGDYKGKLVLLYFWATWCGDCNREIPNVVKTFDALHEKGLEILGISLDHPNDGETLASYSKEHNMSWPEIYEGKVWNGDIVQLYDVTSTPTGFLIDGDTGEILATGIELRGDNLSPTIMKKLAAFSKPVKSETKSN